MLHTVQENERKNWFFFQKCVAFLPCQPGMRTSSSEGVFKPKSEKNHKNRGFQVKLQFLPKSMVSIENRSCFFLFMKTAVFKLESRGLGLWSSKVFQTKDQLCWKYATQMSKSCRSSGRWAALMDNPAIVSQTVIFSQSQHGTLLESSTISWVGRVAANYYKLWI